MLRLNEITLSVREIFLYPFPNQHMLKIRGFVQPTQIAMIKAHIYLGGLGLDAMLRFRTSSLQLTVYL